MEKGSEELLWVSHIVPLPCVVHKGEMSPATGHSRCPEKAGISNAAEQVEMWESFRRHPGAPPTAAVNGSPKCCASFRTTATDTTYSFFRTDSEQS